MTDTLPSLEPLPLVRPADPLVGLRLNGFVITGTLSVGGMGIVYEARHPVIGRRAAVKVIRPELDGHADLAERFLREARAVSAVKHRNVVEILDYGSLPGGEQYMMMEFLEGDTLAETIRTQAPLPPDDALALAEEIFAGLSAAHQVGVVHRDLKPANIVRMKQSGGELIVKLLDFGLARQSDQTPEPPTRESLLNLTHEKASCLAGTPEYMSPEQASGEQVGAQSDVYATGVILYELLTGTLPFSAPSPWELMNQHRFAAPPSLRSIVPGLDPRIAALVARLLAKQPADRPLGAKEAAREISQLRAAMRRRPAWARYALAVAAAAAAVAVTAFVGNPAPAEAAPPDVTMDVTMVATLWPAVAAPEIVEVPAAPAPAPGKVRGPRVTCAPTNAWKHASRDQIEDLAKKSLARMRDDAPVRAVAQVKQRARQLVSSVRAAEGADCAQVEASLKAWRAELR